MFRELGGPRTPFPLLWSTKRILMATFELRFASDAPSICWTQWSKREKWTFHEIITVHDCSNQLSADVSQQKPHKTNAIFDSPPLEPSVIPWRFSTSAPLPQACISFLSFEQASSSLGSGFRIPLRPLHSFDMTTPDASTLQMFLPSLEGSEVARVVDIAFLALTGMGRDFEVSNRNFSLSFFPVYEVRSL